jgi:hypothetical protein
VDQLWLHRRRGRSKSLIFADGRTAIISRYGVDHTGFASKVTTCTWTGSVPPAVAGGSMFSVRYSRGFWGSKVLTHPLPRTVLTRSKCISGLLRQSRSYQNVLTIHAISHPNGRDANQASAQIKFELSQRPTISYAPLLRLLNSARPPFPLNLQA